ncbi:MAG: hypothetical protein ACRDVD_01755 [Acidimicrobiia bacterium]
MSTTTMIRFASACVAAVSLSAAVLGWMGLAAVEASAALAPGVGRATGPTQDLLTAAEDALAEVRSTLTVVASVTDDVSVSTGQAADALEGIAELTSERIPDALAAVESSMPALIETASVIDNTMQTLARVGIPYNPEVPFDDALRDLQAELDGLPEAISDQGANLEALLPQIRTSGEEAGELADHIVAIDASLGDAQAALGEYDATVSDLETAARAGADLAGVVVPGRVAVIILAVAGVGLGLAGWSLADRFRPSL